MTLTERIAHCRTEGCRRAPAFPDQGYCETCRPKWMPAWRQRMLDDVANRGRVAVKELA